MTTIPLNDVVQQNHDFTSCDNMKHDDVCLILATNTLVIGIYNPR